MALIVPNADQIIKETPRIGEALKKVQDYANINITPAAGNKIPPPPTNPSQPPG